MEMNLEICENRATDVKIKTKSTVAKTDPEI